MSKRRYEWDNFASVEMLSDIWRVSKRRVQQVLADMLDKDQAEVVIGVYYDPRNPYARPFYRKIR